MNLIVHILSIFVWYYWLIISAYIFTVSFIASFLLFHFAYSFSNFLGWGMCNFFFSFLINISFYLVSLVWGSGFSCVHNFSHFIYDVIFILVSFLIQEFLKRHIFFTKFQVEEFFFLNFCQKCIALFHVNHKFGADLLPFIGFIENFPHGMIYFHI